MRNKSRKRKGICTFLLLLLVAALFSCGKQEDIVDKDEDFVIGVVTKSRDSEYWMSVCSGMEKAALDFGVSIMIVSPDSETNDVLQMKMIDNLLKKEMDALAISPIDSYGGAEYLEKAKEKEISVYSYDTQIMGEDIPYIGIDNEKAGSELAKYMVQQLGNKGKIGIISGSLNQTAHELRLKGFQNFIEKNSEMEIAFVKSGYSNLQMSEREISDLIQQYPDTDGIFATSAVTALGIMDYLQNSPIKIATVDAQEDAIEAVHAGGIAALATQSGYDIGYETIRYIVNDKNKVQQEKKLILDVEILCPSK